MVLITVESARSEGWFRKLGPDRGRIGEATILVTWSSVFSDGRQVVRKMAALFNSWWQPKRLRFVAALLSLTLGLLWAASATATDVFYLKATTFTVPFKFTGNQQQQIDRVILWVSDNYGKNYRAVAQAAPATGSFQFQAPQQGWYWFTVQAEYKDGRKVPQDASTVQPGLKIFVDTVPPVITLRQAAPRDGTLAIEWDIRDEYPDLLTLRVDYRPTTGGNWVPLNVAQVPYGTHNWTPTVNAAQYDVRLVISDRAGNQADALIRVAPGFTAQQNPSNPPPVGSVPALPRSNMLNTRSIKLTYDVTDKGKSDVVMIEVYATQDTQTWKKVASEVPKSPPCITVNVDKEGRWGFKLIAQSGVGRSEPIPTAGQQPDLWVEIDETKPLVEVQSTDVSGDPKSPRMTIRWTAKDKHLADRPITISYAPGPDGQTWTQLATGLPNDGQYIWPIPTDVAFHQCFIKVEAVDLAGNVGSAQTPKAVIVDLSIPKARVIHFEPAPQSGSGSGPGAGLPRTGDPVASGFPVGQSMITPISATADNPPPPLVPPSNSAPMPQGTSSPAPSSEQKAAPKPTAAAPMMPSEPKLPPQATVPPTPVTSPSGATPAPISPQPTVPTAPVVPKAP
jgi:hypothetical protein